MNTPKTPKPPKRWENRAQKLRWPVPDEGLSWDVKSKAHLTWLGGIVVRFGHLEQTMRKFLGNLLGVEGYAIPGIVFDAIVSPKIRITVMRRLLYEAPENANRTTKWDKIIDEYEAINKLRNMYIHGLWYTSDQSYETLLAPTDGEGLSFLEARPVSIKDMEALVERMHNLELKLLKWKGTD